MSPAAAVLAMQSVARSLRALSAVPARVAVEASEAIDELLAEQFGAETDAYGTPWKPLAKSTVKRRGSSNPILIDSGSMYDSIKIAPMRGAGISITIDPPAEFHQIGTKDMPARRILPTGPLPRSWSQAIKDAADNAFDRWADGAKL